MRPIKRLLVLAGELGVLVFGFGVSFALTAYLDPTENSSVLAVFYAGLTLTVAGFVVIRRKTRPWKIEYDAVGWALAQTERKLHPTRSRCKQAVSRVLVWMPSAIATTVLLFFPAASHLIRPGLQCLTHYRVSIPWTLVVTPVPGVSSDSFVAAFTLIGSNGDFRLTPFWHREIFSSAMGFGNTLYASDVSEDNIITERRHVGAAQLSRRDFRLSDIALSCWQYLPPYDWPYGRRSTASARLWQIDCQTPVGVRGQRFYAWFRGSAADISAFYRITEGVEPIK